MKKTKKFILFAILLCIVGLIIFTASMNLSRFCSYVIGRATDSKATISGVKLIRQGTSLDIRIKGIRLKGNIEGMIKRCDLVIDVAKGIYFKNIFISDFETAIAPVERKGRPFTFPAELIEINNGVITVSGQKVIINDVKIRNINIGDNLQFEAHIQNGDYIGTVDIRGKGIYNKRLTDIKGEIQFTSVNLARIDTILKGSVDGTGTIAFKNNTLIYEGKVEATNFELNDTWLDRPVALDKVGAEVFLSAEGGTVEIKIRQAFYKQTPFALNIRLDKYKYTSLELSSDFLDVQDVIYHATSKHSLRNVWDVLKAGKVKATMLHDAHKGPTTAYLEVKDIGVGYKDMYFDNIQGQVSIDMSRVEISNIRGRYKTSAFNEVSGTIPYNEDKVIKARGKYLLNLKDMPPFVDLRGVRFTGGTTEGAVNVEVRRGSGPYVYGSGKFDNGRAQWKNVSFSTRGSYRFFNDGVVFDPLVVSKDSTTDITCRGKWNQENLDFVVKGAFDAEHLHSLIKMPFKATGILQIDGGLRLDNDILSANGDVNMDDLAFEIPPYMKKERGVKSQAKFRFSKKGADITIQDLLYQLDIIRVNAKGTITDWKKIDAQVALDAHDVGRVAKIFFLPQETTKGDVSLKVAVKDFQLPIEKLPYMTGYVKIDDGFLRIPSLPKLVGHMNLIADFKGSTFDVQMNGFTCGSSALRKGMLHVKGLEAPQFSLFVDMERFDLQDFKGGREYGTLLIPEKSILARAKGDLSLKANDVVLGRIAAKNLDLTGVMIDRKINVSECSLDIVDGNAGIQGIVDLSGKTPYIYANGRLNGIKSGSFLEAIGSTTEDIVGSGFIYGDLKSEGDNTASLIGNMNGNITVYSSDGIIKKWNLLSKIFGLLNVYDLLKGKVNFSREGLKYNKLGATFAVNKGIFNTTNFLLDSSSMVITGKGDLNLNKKDVNGVLQVSPLIAIDRTIDKIPIVRSILKQRGQGFLYITYNVRGPLEDPEITPSVTSTIGYKAIEILRNILVLPKEVFEK